jgi:hypothetical protein
VDFEGTRTAVDDLMGTKPEARFRFIQDRAALCRKPQLSDICQLKSLS